MTDTTASNHELIPAEDAALVASEEWQEQYADEVAAELAAEQGDSSSAGELIVSFTQAAANQPLAEPADWLTNQLQPHAELWPDRASMERDITEIVATALRHAELKQELAAARDQGKSRESWLATSLANAAKQHGILSVGDYGAVIDEALKRSNTTMRTIVTCKNMQLSQARNLDGFIAEVHHVNTFNVNAAAAGSDARASVVINPGQAFAKNSVDIHIHDCQGKVVRRYQAKYGADAGATEELFERGDYRGQRKLVPQGQAADMRKSASEVIEFEGIESTPLSKKEAKRQQEQVQNEQHVHELDWKSADALTVGKRIGKEAAIAVGMSLCLQAGAVIARRCWNRLRGKENISLQQEGKDFLAQSVNSSGKVLLNVAASGALMVASKRGLLGESLKHSPAGRIATIASVALDNVKTMAQLARGEISKSEALDQMANTTACSIAGLALASEGAALGAAIGTVLGPIGTFVGGLTGGIVGGMLGSTAANLAYNASKSLIGQGVALVNSVAQTFSVGVKSIGNAFSRLFT
jgi:hypothetical protein